MTEIKVENNIVFYEGVRISPYAYQKIMYFMYRGDTEVTGFGVSDEEDKSLIIDFYLVKQECTAASVTMGKDCEKEENKNGLDEYVNKMMDKDIFPDRCFRYWLHTHPGNSASPSSQDETQFNEFMADFPWIVMLIFARNKSTTCRLGVSQGPGARVEMHVSVDWSVPLVEVDMKEWETEYQENVTKKTFSTPAIDWKRGPWRENSYTGGYQEIDWSDRPSMQKIPSYYYNDDELDNWEKERGIDQERTYLDDSDELDPNGDLDLFDDIDELLVKDIHAMTSEEFELYEEFCDAVSKTS